MASSGGMVGVQDDSGKGMRCSGGIYLKGQGEVYIWGRVSGVGCGLICRCSYRAPH